MTARCLVVLLLVVGCSSKRAAPKPSPEPVAAARDGGAAGDAIEAPVAMQLDPAKLPADRPFPARELGVPARTVCTLPCPAAAGDDGDRACAVRGAGIVARGFREHIACQPESVALDCCAPLPTERPAAIMAALGWAGASPAQRTAIAWTFERVVAMTAILDAQPDTWPASATFTAPVARADGDALVLDYWRLAFAGIHMRFAHAQASYAADGTRSQRDLGDVDPDAEAIKRQAVEAAGGALDAR